MRNSCTCPDQFRASTPARLVPVENGLLGKGDATRIGEASSLHSCCYWVATFSICFGRVSGRKVASKAIVRAVPHCQVGTPYELLGFTDRLTRANSASDGVSVTNSVQSPSGRSCQGRKGIFLHAVVESTRRDTFSSLPLLCSGNRGTRRSTHGLRSAVRQPIVVHRQRRHPRAVTFQSQQN